jgi:hypothetical protein
LLAFEAGEAETRIRRAQRVSSPSLITNCYFDLMSSHLTEAARELFAACNIPIDRADSVPHPGSSAHELTCMASIGYVGEGVRGVLVLAASRAAAKAWTDAAGIGDCDPADTIGEFSNMLLGHLKVRLIREGIPIALATPITVTGTGLRLSVPPGHSSWQFFDGPSWRLGTRLNASFDSDFRVQSFDESQEPASPGDAIIF